MEQPARLPGTDIAGLQRADLDDLDDWPDLEATLDLKVRLDRP